MRAMRLPNANALQAEACGKLYVQLVEDCRSIAESRLPFTMFGVAYEPVPEYAPRHAKPDGAR